MKIKNENRQLRKRHERSFRYQFQSLWSDLCGITKVVQYWERERENTPSITYKWNVEAKGPVFETGGGIYDATNVRDEELIREQRPRRKFFEKLEFKTENGSFLYAVNMFFNSMRVHAVRRRSEIWNATSQ